MPAKYIFFGYADYYPMGGTEDIQFTFNNMEEFEDNFDEDEHIFDNYNILNVETFDSDNIRFNENDVEILFDWVRKVLTKDIEDKAETKAEGKKINLNINNETVQEISDMILERDK